MARHIAAALIDSPVGLAARIIDKFHDWAVDHDGNLEDRISCPSRANLPTASAATSASQVCPMQAGASWRSTAGSVWADILTSSERPTTTFR